MPLDSTTIDTPLVRDLKRAKKYINKPKHWCKGKEHTTLNGVHQYCSLGALVHAFGYKNAVTSDYETAIKLFVNVVSRYHSISSFNDHPNTTHAMVMDAFDTAIKLAEEL